MQNHGATINLYAAWKANIRYGYQTALSWSNSCSANPNNMKYYYTYTKQMKQRITHSKTASCGSGYGCTIIKATSASGVGSWEDSFSLKFTVSGYNYESYTCYENVSSWSNVLGISPITNNLPNNIYVATDSNKINRRKVYTCNWNDSDNGRSATWVHCDSDTCPSRC